MWSVLNRTGNLSIERTGGGDLRLGRGNREDVQQARLLHPTRLLPDDADGNGTPAQQTALERFEEVLGLPPKQRENLPSESELDRLQKRFDLCFDRCRRFHKICLCKPKCGISRCSKQPVVYFDEVSTMQNDCGYHKTEPNVILDTRWILAG